MTGMETKRARGKCIANALVCQLCWTFLFTSSIGVGAQSTLWARRFLPAKYMYENLQNTRILQDLLEIFSDFFSGRGQGVGQMPSWSSYFFHAAAILALISQRIHPWHELLILSKHISAAGVVCSRPWSLHWRWRHHEDSRHQHRESVLFIVASAS